MEFAAEQQQREYDQQDIAYELGAVKAERDMLRAALMQIIEDDITWKARMALRAAAAGTERASAARGSGERS